MSLDILKERFSGKPIASEYEEQIDNQEKIIEQLEEKSLTLSNQVNVLQNEKTTLIQELNQARNFEEGTFSIKEKDYINEIQSRENIIKELKSEFNPLYEKIDKQEDRLLYKDNMIKNSLDIIKEAKNKINYLNTKLQNSKNSKKELQLEIKKTYQDYIFKMNNLENDIKDRNDIINEQKQILKENNKNLKESINKIQELKAENTKDKKTINELSIELKESKTTLVLENDVFKQKLNEKEKNISKLETKIENLSEKVIGLSETAREKTILEQKLAEAESFQEIVKNNKNNYQLVPQKKSKLLNTDNLIFKLKEISKQKQGPKKLDWNQWLEIPESQYLFELNEAIAKKAYRDNNQVADPYFLKERYQNQSQTQKRTYAPYKASAAQNFNNSYLALDWDFSSNTVTSSIDVSGNKLFRGVASIEQTLDYADYAKNTYSGSWGIRDYMNDSSTITPDNRVVTDSDGVQNLLLASVTGSDTTIGGQIRLNNDNNNDGTGLDAASALPGYLEPSNDTLPVQIQNDNIRALGDIMSEDVQKTYVLTFMVPETTAQGNPNTGSANYQNRKAYIIHNNAMPAYTEGGDGEELQWRFGIPITPGQTSAYLKPMIGYSKLGSFSGGGGSVSSPTAITHGTKHVIFLGFDRTSNNKFFIQLYGGTQEEGTLIYDPDNGTPSYSTGGDQLFEMLSNGHAGQGVSQDDTKPEWHVYDFRVYDKYLDGNDMDTVYGELKDKYILPDV